MTATMHRGAALIAVLLCTNLMTGIHARKVGPGAPRSEGSWMDVAAGRPSDGEAAAFGAWKQAHGKTYETDEEHERRMSVWLENRRFIEETASALGAESGMQLELGAFADISREEFAATRKGLLTGAGPAAAAGAALHDLEDLPESVDWRAKGVVTPVKNQGSCGSCWSFSVTGAIESANAIATGKLVELSEQELVSCAKNGNAGCRGGDMKLAMDWIIWNGGIDTEEDYPYHGMLNPWPFCRRKKQTGDKAVNISKYQQVLQNDNKQLLAAVATNGPISVGIDATGPFQFYKGGVIPAKVCGDQLDHGVLLVGYGVDDETKKPYWLVKNSWGKSWGEDGYFKLERLMDAGPGSCGISMEAIYPTIGPTHATPKSSAAE